MFLKDKFSILKYSMALLMKLIYSALNLKSILRPYLDYWDVIYDKPRNENFIDTLELIQCNATLL